MHSSALRTYARSLHDRASAQFPDCFAPRGEIRQPLKLKIRDDLVSRGWAEDDAKIFLKKYVNSLALYRTQCAYGAARIDLDGVACGSVTIDEAAHAGGILIDNGLAAEAAVIALSVGSALVAA